MNTFDFTREWEFITAETHNEKPSETNLMRREVLFGLQILLGRAEMGNYLALKKIYCAEESEPGH